MVKSLLPYLLLLGALAYFIPQGCANDRAWEAWQADTQRLLRSIDGMKSQKLILERENDSLRKAIGNKVVVAERNANLARGAKAEADSFRALLDSSQNAPDSLQNALWLAERLGVAYDSLNSAYHGIREAFLAQSLLTQRLTVSEKQAWSAVDSLSALIRRTPGCQRIPILGIPVPKVGIGVGVGLKGPGLMLGVVVPLSCR